MAALSAARPTELEPEPGNVLRSVAANCPTHAGEREVVNRRSSVAEVTAMGSDRMDSDEEPTRRKVQGVTDSDVKGLGAQKWLASQQGTVLPKRILGGSERDLAKLGFSLGPEIDDLFQSGRPPKGWQMRPSDRSAWSYIYDEKGHQRVGVFFKESAGERLAHMMILADGGALA